MIVIHDYYCGLGGWSCGAATYFKSIGINDVEFHGYEIDGVLLERWQFNLQTMGFKAVKHEVRIDKQTIFPDDADELMIHFSPPCVVHSRARRTPPTPEEAQDGVDSLKLVLQTIVNKAYKRFSVENVCTTGVERIVKEFTEPNRWMKSVALCASHHGCGSDRVRLFVLPSQVAEAVSRVPNTTQSILDALAEHRLVPPQGATHIRNANSDTKRHRPLSGTSFTILASHSLTFTDGRETIRGLSPEESAALMSFPIEWTLLPGKQKKKNLIGVGNAIAPRVSHLLAKCLYETQIPVGATAVPPVTTASTPLVATNPSSMFAVVLCELVKTNTTLDCLKRKLDDISDRILRMEHTS